MAGVQGHDGYSIYCVQCSNFPDDRGTLERVNDTYLSGYDRELMIHMSYFSIFYETEHYFGSCRGCDSGRKPVLSVNRPDSSRGYQEICGVGFLVQ